MYNCLSLLAEKAQPNAASRNQQAKPPPLPPCAYPSKKTNTPDPKPESSNCNKKSLRLQSELQALKYFASPSSLILKLA